MKERWAEIFRQLRFKPNPMGGMDGRLEDIEFTAADHPFGGVVLFVNHVGRRTALQWERHLPESASIQDVASVIAEAYREAHPEMAKAVELDLNTPRPN